MAQCFFGKPSGRSSSSSGVKSGIFCFECEYQTEFIAKCFAKEYIYKLNCKPLPEACWGSASSYSGQVSLGDGIVMVCRRDWLRCLSLSGGEVMGCSKALLGPARRASALQTSV